MKRNSLTKPLRPVWILGVLLTCCAAQAQAQDLDKLAADLAVRIHAAKQSSVTVVDFLDLDKKPTKLGKFLAYQLQAALADPRHNLEVVDQSQLSELFDQMELLSEGLIDPATARQLGKIAGTEVLIVGTVMVSSLSVRLDVKAIDLQTAKMITAGSASPKRFGLIDRLAKQAEGETETAAAEEGAGAASPAAAKTSPSKPPQAPPRTIRDQQVEFAFNGCSLSGGTLTCALTVTSEARDRQLAVAFASRAWNEAGEEFGPDEVMIANSRSERDCAVKEVLKNVPTRVSLTFPQFGDNFSSVERLRLHWAESDDCWTRWRPVDFEKIALSEDANSSQRAAGGSGNAAGNTGKSGGLLRRLGSRVMDRLEDAATQIIDEKTHGLLGPSKEKKEKEEPEEPPQY